MGRWFAHPLGVCKSVDHLNDLSRLESRHNGPNLGLINLKSNRSNIENAIDTLQVQTDLDSSNSGNNRATNAISRPRIKCLHQSQENRLKNSHHEQPTYPIENTLKPEMLEFEEIDISPRNYFPLSKVLFVPLIILHRAK